MLSKRLQDALNEQINYELYSEYLYLSIQGYCASANLDGFANFFAVQIQEERFHAMKFFNFLIEKGGKAVLKKIDAPQAEFASPYEAFKLSLEHEQSVTARINKLMDLAIEENDHSMRSLVQWFVDEQVEEEATFEKNIAKLKLIGDNGYGLLMLDAELATRTFVPPTTTAA